MDKSELVYKGIRSVTLALLPLTQVGCGPRGLAKLELGDRELEKEQTDYPSDDQLQVPMASGAV